jgi:HlyD family secretion protein
MAARSIFRKVALDRLTAPEQIDTLLVVTSARSWILLLTTVALLAAAVVWGYIGTVTTKATGQGVIIRTGGVQDIVALGAGQVMNVSATMGAQIHTGDVVATVAQPAMADRIRAAEGAIRDLEEQRRQMAALHSGNFRLQGQSISEQRASLERQISDLEKQAKLVREEIPVEQELLAKELITRQQTYETQQKLAGLESSIVERRAQITQLEARRFQAEKEGSGEEIQVSNRIADARRQLEGLRREMEETSKVRSPYSGQVIEVKQGPGSLVQPGTPIIGLQSSEVHLEALVYVPADHAKETKPGMAAEISPASVKREEFGFIRGKVTFVADYPATESALMRVFENAPLVRALAGGGPVTEVHVQMEADPTTPSGFRWSTSRGSPSALSGGTMIAGDIVTREQPPISLVIPYLREKLGIR